MKKILIVDDHPIVRQGIRSLLLSESDLSIRAEASSVSEALTALDSNG